MVPGRVWGAEVVMVSFRSGETTRQLAGSADGEKLAVALWLLRHHQFGDGARARCFDVQWEEHMKDKTGLEAASWKKVGK